MTLSLKLTNKNKILSLFKKLGAIQSGHFLLTSGNHSDTYLQCARIFENPKITQRLCRILISPWQGKQVDVVAGPAVGGIIIAYELARLVGARAIYLERVEGKLALRREFTIKPKEKTLVVEDVITTGGSAQEVVDIVRNQGGKLIGVVSLVDRSGGQNWSKIFGVKFNSLLKLTLPLYAPDQCPLCQAGLPLVKPGSRNLK